MNNSAIWGETLDRAQLHGTT